MVRPTRNGVAAFAGGVAFAAFVVVKGVPTLRHDWNWPIDARAIASFFDDAVGGWLSAGFGVAATHPTTYLIGLPLAGTMLLFGTLAALALFAFATGYCCMRAAESVAALWGNDRVASIGIGAFALFNPWVYNEVVAGHLVMVLAYGAFIGLVAEMARGANASPVRLALWLVLVEAQLQFLIVAFVAVVIFAFVTKKWLPVIAGAIVGSPSAIGLVAERGPLLQTPYSLEWQTNQSLSALPLLSLGGYFPGYADQLGTVAQVAVWIIVALAVAGVVVARRRRAVLWAAVAATFIYVVALGVRGPLAAPYEWIVQQLPESGVFRELYDLAGIFAALLIVPASAAIARVRIARYIVLAAGIALPVSWSVHPPSELWIGAQSYPHPLVAAAPYSRVAFIPAFQPLQLRAGGGDGADPDLFLYPNHAVPLNEYFPTYPVDAALARYEQSGDSGSLRALGVSAIVNRPWLLSRSKGEIGLAGASLPAPTARLRGFEVRRLFNAAPLLARCDGANIVAAVDDLNACDVFFGDAPGYGSVVPVREPSDSIDPRTAWIDARLAFARVPELAQGLGGVLTQSRALSRVTPGSWLLVYVRGRLRDAGGRVLQTATGAFSWISVPPSVEAVTCEGLCELIAESRAFPGVPLHQRDGTEQPVAFAQLAPWLYRVRGATGGMLRFNSQYDPGWMGVRAWHVLPHLRVGLAANGWLLSDGRTDDVILVQITAFWQLVAELAGVICTALLLKALVRQRTKRA